MISRGVVSRVGGRASALPIILKKKKKKQTPKPKTAKEKGRKQKTSE